MGSGGKGAVSNTTAEQGQGQLAQSLSGLLTQEQDQSQELFNLAFPGTEQASNFYQALASGSPNLIAAASAPATQQITQASTGAKQNILNNAPSGGEKNLALESVDVNQGAQVGQVASQGYLSAQNALAGLGQSGVGQSQGAASTAISAGQAAGNQWSNIVQQNMQQKGASLGAFGGLAGDATSLGSAKIGASSAGKGAAITGGGAASDALDLSTLLF